MIVHLNWDYIDNAFFLLSANVFAFLFFYFFLFLPQFQDFISRNLGWKHRSSSLYNPKNLLMPGSCKGNMKWV